MRTAIVSPFFRRALREAAVTTPICKNNKVAQSTFDPSFGFKKRENKTYMKVGDRVRVINSVVVYHHPQHKKEPFDLKEMEGEVIDIVTEWRGRPVSANLPILVKFDKTFKAHFRENELEVL